MITRTAPWDKKHVRRSRRPTLNICLMCGNVAIDTPRGVRCSTCPSTIYTRMPEGMVDAVRVAICEIEANEALHLSGLIPYSGGACQLNWGG